MLAAAAAAALHALFAQASAGHPAPDTSGCYNGAQCPANFSAHFQTHMVLQSAPSQAALYGMAPVAGSTVTVSLLGATDNLEVVSSSVSATVSSSLTWKILFPAQQPGGNFSVAVACTKGCTNSTATTITDVTFGDVWVCSGQSNAELSVHFTFDRNDSVAAILEGRYNNVRLMMGTHKSATSPQFVHKTRGGASWHRVTDLVNATATEASTLFGFPAMCWYFGKSLTDKMAAATASATGGVSSAPPPPLGMVNAVWGGTTIEQWTPNIAQQKCATWHPSGGALQPSDGSYKPRITPSCMGCSVNASGGGCNMSTHPQNCKGNGALYNGNIGPLVNMSIKGMTWCEWRRDDLCAIATAVSCYLLLPQQPAASCSCCCCCCCCACAVVCGLMPAELSGYHVVNRSRRERCWR
jgi:hypothetical protein